MKNLPFILFSLFLLSCNSSKQRELLPDGLNYTTTDGSYPKEEFYVHNGKRHGVYVKYWDTLKIQQIGTYRDDKRDGFWDDSSGLIFYYDYDARENVTFSKKDYFSYYKFIDFDFTIFNPSAWHILDSLASKASLESYKIVQDTFEPHYEIHRLNNSTTDIDTVIANYRSAIEKDSTFMEFMQTSRVTYAVTNIQEGVKIRIHSKIINTKTGIYRLNIKCMKHDYVHSYYEDFKTVLNSFNPISSTRQWTTEQSPPVLYDQTDF